LAKAATGGRKRTAIKLSRTEAEAPKRARAPDGRRGILVRAKPEAWKALKLIALDQEITLQDAMTSAINDYLRRNGKPKVRGASWQMLSRPAG
jgi:hypothetical protein